VVDTALSAAKAGTEAARSRAGIMCFMEDPLFGIGMAKRRFAVRQPEKVYSVFRLP
jgi:hypothetical protein